MARLFEALTIQASEAAGCRHAASFDFKKKRGPSDRFFISGLEGHCISTLCHAVRHLWNKTALLKHGKEAHCMVLECKVDETIKGEPLTIGEKYAVYQRQINLDSRQ